MRAPNTSAVLIGLNLSVTLFWLTASAAKVADHDNFVRQLTSLTGSAELSLFLSIAVPIVCSAIAIALLLGLGSSARRRWISSWISLSFLVGLTSLFLYIDFYKPMGVCACLALSAGLEWQGSWIVAGVATLLCLLSVAVQVIQRRRAIGS